MDLVQIAPAAYDITDDYWHLLKAEDGTVYILVECEASFVSYKCLIKLNAEELRDYHGLGWLSFLSQFSQSVPGTSDRMTHSPYFEHQVLAAIQQ